MEKKSKLIKDMQKLREEIFSQLAGDFAKPVKTWQKQRPSKRNAFMLFCDKEIGRWSAFMYGNPRSKYHTATSLDGLLPAMKKFPELLDAMRAYVRCAERELKKEAKAKAQKESSHGTDSV